MPTLRLLADGRPVYASPGAPDRAGIPSFLVGGGETVRVDLDLTAWLGAAAFDVISWDVSGGSIAATSEAGPVSSALVAVPQQPLSEPDLTSSIPVVTLQHVVQATDGRIKRTLLRLYPQPASITPAAILDEAVLG